jgi:5'-3' exonuclease
MGIRYLNKYFREECKNTDAIKIIYMKQLSGKKIAVDISIYMYKFASENKLIENIYLMLSIFRHYNIIPVFVFDGKAPAEKKELIQQRIFEKKAAENEFNQLKNNLEYNSNIDEYEKHEIMNKMDILKKKFIYISKNQIDDVKNLITYYGMTYCDAPNEADELCAMFAIKGIVWACLSEDMDMFLYGCPRVLRYLSLMNHTFVLYDTKQILNRLQINQNELREICVISGTDYNANNANNVNHCDLFTSLKYFKKYKNFQKNLNNDNNDNESTIQKYSFYNWLTENTKYLEKYEDDMFASIYSMFVLDDEYLKDFEIIKIRNGQVIHNVIKEILKKDGFLFVNI